VVPVIGETLTIATLIIRDLAIVGTAVGEFGEIGRSAMGLDCEQVRAILTSLAYDPPRASGYLGQSYRRRSAARSCSSTPGTGGNAAHCSILLSRKEPQS